MCLVFSIHLATQLVMLYSPRQFFYWFCFSIQAFRPGFQGGFRGLHPASARLHGLLETFFWGGGGIVISIFFSASGPLKSFGDLWSLGDFGGLKRS